LAILLALFATGVLPYAEAQVNPNKAPAAAIPAVIPYAVSTVRENKGAPLVHVGMPIPRQGIGIDVGKLTIWYQTLRRSIGFAYSLQDRRILGGPAWLDSEHFDIIAKSDDADNAVPKALTYDLQQKYNLRQVQLLLEDRFRLKMHTEQREIPVYALVVAKGGPKIKLSDDKSSPEQFGLHGFVGGRGIRDFGNGRFFGIGNSIDQLVSKLAISAAGDLDRPVVNMTGLTGLYDFQLQWTPGLGAASDQPDSSRPDLFTAVQEQLGLKLEPRKSSMDVLVIDHVELPTEN
jgi:uncharacterized protein (TIGR03435 family)